MLREKTIQLKSVHFFLKLKDGVTYVETKPLTLTLKKTNSQFPSKQFLVAGSPVEKLPYVNNPFPQQQETGLWSIEVNRAQEANRADIPDWLRVKNPTGGDEVVTINDAPHYRLNSGIIDDLYMVWEYQVA